MQVVAPQDLDEADVEALPSTIKELKQDTCSIHRGLVTWGGAVFERFEAWRSQDAKDICFLRPADDGVPGFDVKKGSVEPEETDNAIELGKVRKELAPWFKLASTRDLILTTCSAAFRKQHKDMIEAVQHKIEEQIGIVCRYRAVFNTPPSSTRQFVF